MILTIALLASAGTASAQQLMIPYDGGGCQVLAPYAWFELAPRATWTATVDLRSCGPSDFGWYDFYGFIKKPGGADPLSGNDGIELRITSTSTRETATSGNPNRAGQDVFMIVSAPGRFQLTAVNTGRKTQTIRLSWLKLSYRSLRSFDTDSDSVRAISDQSQSRSSSSR